MRNPTTSCVNVLAQRRQKVGSNISLGSHSHLYRYTHTIVALPIGFPDPKTKAVIQATRRFTYTVIVTAKQCPWWYNVQEAVLSCVHYPYNPATVYYTTLSRIMASLAFWHILAKTGSDFGKGNPTIMTTTLVSPG